jgi:hypothetical protein
MSATSSGGTSSSHSVSSPSKPPPSQSQLSSSSSGNGGTTECVRVLVRMRPMNERELNEAGAPKEQFDYLIGGGPPATAIALTGSRYVISRDAQFDQIAALFGYFFFYAVDCMMTYSM